MFLSFPAGTKMFQFPAFAPVTRYTAFDRVGSPIQTSPDHFLFADPRSFSQLTTSFFAFGSQGILRSLLFSFSYFVNHMRLLTSHITRFAFEIAVPFATRKNSNFKITDYNLLTSFYLVISLSIVNELCIFPFVSERDCKGSPFF